MRTRKGGRVVIDFYSDEELDRIYAIITRGAVERSRPPSTLPPRGGHPSEQLEARA